MRRLSAFSALFALALLPGFAVAGPLPDAGAYTPSAYAKAAGKGDQAILLHVVSKFCGTCEAQKQAVVQTADMLMGVERHVSMMDVPLEIWKDSVMLEKIGASKAGTLVLVRGGEVLGRVEGADMMAITDLLTPLVPSPAGGMVDPSTGLPLDPATGLPIDPNTGIPAQ